MQLLKPKLDQLYQHTGLAEEVADALRRVGAMRSAPDRYELQPTWSWGTSKGFKGIYVTINVVAETPTSQHIRFTTVVRPEHYVMAVMFLIITMASFHSRDWKMVLFMLLLWPVFFLWFQVVYRSQEQELVNGLVRRLRLKLLSPVE